MATENDIKLEFIRQELDKHGDWLKRLFLTQLVKYKHIRTNDLFESVEYNVVNIGNGYELQFEFLDYGRFFDIAAYEGKKKRNDWTQNTNRMMWGLKERKAKKRIKNVFYNPAGGELGYDYQKNTKTVTKNNKWYARTMYGGLGRLVASLLYDLGDEEIARIKSQIENTFN